MEKGIAKKLILEYQEYTSKIPMVRRNIEMQPGNNYVLVGLRRAGKSFLMYQFIHDLIAEGHNKEEILYFNFEDDRASHLTLADLDLIKVMPMKNLLIITKDEESTINAGEIKIEVIPLWKWLLDAK